MKKASFIVAVLASVLSTAFVLLFAFCRGEKAFTIERVKCEGKNMEYHKIMHESPADSCVRFFVDQDSLLFFDWYTDGKNFILSVNNQSENDIEIEKAYMVTPENRTLSCDQLIAVNSNGKEIDRSLKIACGNETNITLKPESILNGEDKDKNIFPRFPFWIGADYKIKMEVWANQFLYSYTFIFGFPVGGILKGNGRRECLPFERYEYQGKCINHDFDRYEYDKYGHPLKKVKVEF